MVVDLLIVFIEERKWLYYTAGVVLLTVFFHNSAIILLPFYFIDRDFLKNRLLQLSIYLSVVLFTTIFTEQIKFVMDSLYLMFSGGGFSIIRYLSSETIAIQTKSSIIGQLFYLIVAIYLIMNSVEFKQNYGKMGVIAYNFSFLGLLITHLVFNRGIERINIYFYSFIFIVLGLMVFQKINGYFKKDRIMYVYTVGVLMLFVIWFANSVLQGAAGCSPYVLNPEL